jgi:hypothetical protein
MLHDIKEQTIKQENAREKLFLKLTIGQVVTGRENRSCTEDEIYRNT